MKDTPKNAALLVRISDDRDGEGAGVGRQEKDSRTLADRLGWTIGPVFTENDTSAYKRRTVTLPDGSTGLRVHRPQFRALLDAIRLGQVDGLIAYHLDRVARDPRDLEDLIDVVEQTRLPVESVTGSLRLASDADITMARIGVAIANQSSRDASRRIRRKQDEMAEQGAWRGGGARPYGYGVPTGQVVTVNGQTREVLDMNAIREDEAEVLRYAAQRVLEGVSVNALCKELDEQGHRPVKAERWSSRALSDQLRSARVAGLRKHRGEIVGPAQWPAILDRDTWEAVQATLAGRRASVTRRALEHWLNDVLICGRCGLGMKFHSQPEDRSRYWCLKSRHRPEGCGRIAIRAAGAEAEAERQIVAYLSREDVLQSLADVTSRRGAESARADLAADEQQLRDLSRLWAEKAITLDEYAEARKIIKARIDGAKAVQLAQVPESARKVLAAKDPAAAWVDLPAVPKRETALLLLHSRGFRGWTVTPHDPTKARRFDPTRMVLSEVES